MFSCILFSFKNSHPDTSRSQLTAWVRVASIALVLVFSAVNVSHAQGSDAQRREAIAHAMDQAGGSGKVISVKPYKQSNGEPGFRVRILTDGRVRTFDVPAKAE